MNQPLTIEWTERRVAVKDLRPNENNPRRIAPEDRERLKKSIQEMGYHQRLLVTPDLRIIGGHQRRELFLELGMKEIIALVPSRELTDEEFDRLSIQDNLSFGEFDLKKLGIGFKINKLIEWGMPRSTLGFLGTAEDPNDHWKGMPQFQNEDKTAFRQIIISFANQEAVNAFAQLIGQKLTQDTKSVWYPKAEIETYMDKHYDGEKK